MATFIYFLMSPRVTRVVKAQSAGFSPADRDPRAHGPELFPLTLIDVEKGLAELVGEQGLGEVPEELLHHVRHVVGRLVLVADVLREVLVHLT